MLPASFTPKLLRQLELLKLSARRSFLGARQGGHLSVKRGQGIEFSDYRQYELGDNPRHIDWGVYARSERLYVKRFQEEQDLTVLVVLDTSASMMVPEGEKKWARAIDIALALSYVALMQQDSVVVSALGEFLSPHYHGARAIHHLSHSLMNLPLKGGRDLRREMQKTVSRIRFPGVAIFISDFLMPLGEVRTLLDILRAKNLEITTIQVLGESDVNPLPSMSHATAVDSESGDEAELELDDAVREQYGQLLVEHTDGLKTLCAEGRIAHALVTTEESLSEVVVQHLARTGLLA